MLLKSVLLSSVLVSSVIGGSLSPNNLSMICKLAEYNELYRNVCYSHGGFPVGAAYELSKKQNARRIDYCRLAETIESSRKACEMLGGVSYKKEDDKKTNTTKNDTKGESM